MIDLGETWLSDEELGLVASGKAMQAAKALKERIGCDIMSARNICRSVEQVAAVARAVNLADAKPTEIKAEPTTTTQPPAFLQPMQPVVMVDGVARFKANTVVRRLLAFATARGFGLTDMIHEPGSGVQSKEDWTQFYQLIGYSVSGAGDLLLFDEGVLRIADEQAEALLEKTK